MREKLFLEIMLIYYFKNMDVCLSLDTALYISYNLFQEFYFPPAHLLEFVSLAIPRKYI